MADVNIGQVASLAIKNYAPKVFDSVSNNIGYLNRLESKGNLEIKEGGEELVYSLAYNENDTYIRYSGAQQWDIREQQEFDAATYDWRQVGIAIPFNGLETDVIHVGKPALKNLVKERTMNAERSMKNNFSGDVYSDGTEANQIGGLQAIVPDTAGGTIGGIDGSTYSWWQNYVLDASDAGAAVTAANIRSYMNKVYVNCTRGADHPDLIIADNNYFLDFLESLQANQRFSGDPKLAAAGFETIKYLGADVICDGGYGGDAPANHMYFLNTDYLKLVSAKNRNFTAIDPDRYSSNQDAFVKLMAWAGNLVCTNRFAQGVLVA